MQLEKVLLVFGTLELLREWLLQVIHAIMQGCLVKTREICCEFYVELFFWLFQFIDLHFCGYNLSRSPLILPLPYFVEHLFTPQYLELFNPFRLNPARREKIKLNFYFQTSLWCLKRFYEHHKEV